MLIDLRLVDIWLYEAWLLENEELSLGKRLRLQITRVVGVEQKILAIPPGSMESAAPGFKLGQTQVHRLSASETVTMLRDDNAPSEYGFSPARAAYRPPAQ
jgi:hypothetical protein